METLTFESDNKGSLILLKEYAKKLGIYLKKSESDTEKKRREEIKRMLQIADASVLPNDLTMEDIVEEVRLSRLARDRK